MPQRVHAERSDPRFFAELTQVRIVSGVLCRFYFLPFAMAPFFWKKRRYIEILYQSKNVISIPLQSSVSLFFNGYLHRMARCSTGYFSNGIRFTRRFVPTYKINGQPVSAIYYVSKDCQYLFKPSGEFEGVWFKHKLYNGKNKVILTRTTY